jgi:hypothetical protein
VAPALPPTRPYLGRPPSRVTPTATRSWPRLIGLTIAALSSLLDLLAIGVLLSPSADRSGQGRPYLLVGIAFALLGIVTLAGVAGSRFGSGRIAVWTVIGSRLVRAALWLLWAVTLSFQADALVVNLLPPLAVAALLGWSLRRSRTRESRTRPPIQY